MKLYIIGNMGSGKSYIAKELDLIHLDLDTIFWKDNSYNERNLQFRRLLSDFMESNDSWVIEGVYTSVASRILKQATHLIYLDVPWEECKSNLIAKNVMRLDYAESYYTGRRESRGNEIYSKCYHDILFDKFDKSKFRIRSKDELNNLKINLGK